MFLFSPPGGSLWGSLPYSLRTLGQKGKRDSYIPGISVDVLLFVLLITSYIKVRFRFLIAVLWKGTSLQRNLPIVKISKTRGLFSSASYLLSAE